MLSVLASDILSLGVAMAFASWVVFGNPLVWRADTAGQGSPWPFIAFMFGGAVLASYLSILTWGKVAPRPSYGRALAIVGITVGFTALALVVTRVYWSRPLFLLTAVVWLTLALFHRAVRRQRPWSEQLVLVTAEKSLAEDLRDAPHARLIEVYSPWEQPPATPVAQEVTLVVDLRAVLSEDMAQFVSSSSIAGTTIRSLTEVYEEHTGRIPLVHLAEGWELTQPVARSSYAPLKRILDLVVTVLLAPIWVLVALGVGVAVRLDSPGPIVFRQSRVGRKYRSFTLYKFRTMQADAEADGPQFAKVGDPRLTRVGRFLRTSHLDEVPQLWNVVRGELSLVGPRPERPVFVEEFERTIPFYASRTVIRPGVTGWAQVNYGYADDEADTVEKLTYDLYYVKHSSLWFDIQILGRSIWTVLTGFGAR